MHRTVPVPHLRKLVAGQPSPATCLMLKDARDYYANYNAAAPAPLARSSPTARIDHIASLPQPDEPSPIVVIDESPSPILVNAQPFDDISIQDQPDPLHSRSVGAQSHQSSQNSENTAATHSALLPEPKGTVDPDQSHDTDDVSRLSFCQKPPCNEPLPSFAELETEVDRYIREHTTALPSIANDQSGPLDGLLTPRNRQDADDRTTVDRFLPRTMNRAHVHVSHSNIPSLRSDKLGQDVSPLTRCLTHHQDLPNDSSIDQGNAVHTRGNLLMQPDRHHTEQSRSNADDLTRSTPTRTHTHPRADKENLTDEQALDILETNPTIAEEFRRACAIRLQQYQQSLDKAYNRRLAEMEVYTREWRNHTKKLWHAVRAGQFDPADMSNQSAIAWQGPQDMAKSDRYHLPVIDTRVGQPVILENGQAHVNGPNAYRVSSASPTRTAPPVPTRIRREARPGPSHCEQNDAGPHQRGPPHSGRSRSHTQTKLVSSGVPEQLSLSRPASSQRITSESLAFYSAPDRPTTPQPESSSGPVYAETKARQPTHCQPPNQSIPDEPILVHPDPILNVPVQASQRQLLGHKWINDFGGYVKESSGKYSSKSSRLLNILSSSSLGSSFTSSLKLSYSAILLGVKSRSSEFNYRKFERVHGTKNIAHPSDVVIELSEANVFMFGKAFCYLKKRRDLLRSLIGLDRRRRLEKNEQSQRIYTFFCQQPTNRALNTMRHPQNTRHRFPSKAPVHETRKLLIARPEHEDGHITGARYFDVGSEQPTIKAEKGKCLLVQDRHSQ